MQPRRRRLLLLPLALVAGQACAQPAHIAAALPGAREAGRGVFTWFGLAVYEAVLWVGPAGYDAARPEAHPFVLDLRYAMALKGGRVAAASAEQMALNGAGTAQQREGWLRAMRTLFPDVKSGSHLSGAFEPGVGARFFADGAMLGTIPDPVFAAAFFGIWLAPATSAPELRRRLLAGAGPGGVQ
jgi:hypothetical protein